MLPAAPKGLALLADLAFAPTSPLTSFIHLLAQASGPSQRPHDLLYAVQIPVSPKIAASRNEGSDFERSATRQAVFHFDKNRFHVTTGCQLIAGNLPG